jgi:hypothetical protein
MVAGVVWISAKYWSEWQDLNLRPPRPERGALSDIHFAHPLAYSAQSSGAD